MLRFCPVCGKGELPLNTKQHCRIKPMIEDTGKYDTARQKTWYPVYEQGKYQGFKSRIRTGLMKITTKGSQIRMS